MSQDIQVTTLSNGLRVVTAPMPGTEIAATGVWVGVGSRYETKEETALRIFSSICFSKEPKPGNPAKSGTPSNPKAVR